MRTDEAIARAQPEDTERANSRMIEEIKNLNADNQRLRKALQDIRKPYAANGNRLIHSELQIIQIADAALNKETSNG